MKPFSTYPEDRQTLLDLCAKVEGTTDADDFESAAYELADLVRAILEDEAVVIASEQGEV